MKNILLAAALALGLGFAATGAQAAAVSGNVAAIDTVAKTGNAVEKAHYYGGYYYRHRHWRDRYYYRRHHWRPRPFGYRNYYHRRHYRDGYYYR